MFFWTREHFKGGESQVPQNFEGVAYKGGRGEGGEGGGSDRFRIFFGGGLGGEVNISGWG